MNLPILFIHKGFQEYFQCALKLARELNPKNKIYLIGEPRIAIKNMCEELDITFFNIEEINASCNQLQEFSNSYQHKSKGYFGFEKFCFERWILANEITKITNQKKLVLLDSDNLLFLSTREIFRKNALDSDLTLFSYGKPHLVLASNKFLDKFSNYLCLFNHAKNNFFDLLNEIYKTKYINDMVILDYFTVICGANTRKANKILNSPYSEDLRNFSNSLKINIENQLSNGIYKNWLFRQLLEQCSHINFNPDGRLEINSDHIKNIEDEIQKTIKIQKITNKIFPLANIHLQGKSKLFATALFSMRQFAKRKGINLTLKLKDIQSRVIDQNKLEFDNVNQIIFSQLIDMKIT